MPEKYTPPTFLSDGFHCPFCGVYSHQYWYSCSTENYIEKGRMYPSTKSLKDIIVCKCDRCEKFSIWENKKLIHPRGSLAPEVNEDTPEDVKIDFEEARLIVKDSPRAAAALLRLAIQKLMPHLRATGKDLNDNIKDLVSKGLSPVIQQALDSVRVIGNNAVHPGELDLRDDVDTALSLFGLVNLIVDAMITQPRKVKEIYSKLPEKAKEAVKKRDSK